jgi:hypothetical protein
MLSYVTELGGLPTREISPRADNSHHNALVYDISSLKAKAEKTARADVAPLRGGALKRLSCQTCLGKTCIGRCRF